jgi:predicted Rossmann fold nucleotide-binding protein DprA/Smf involved in DNA uptake
MILRNPDTLVQSEHRLWYYGNARLVDERLNAILCSRACPGTKIIEALDLAQQWRVENRSVISGFHTAVEKECLRIFLRGPQHTVICPARGLDPFKLPGDWRTKYDRGELLIVSRFDSSSRPTKETAEIRNRLVVELATHCTIIYATPGGVLDGLTGTQTPA